MSKRVTNNQAVACIARIEEFRNNGSSNQPSFYAVRVSTASFLNTGLLVGAEREAMRDAMKAGDVSYVVYSYQTPIAYVVNGEFVTIDKKFSVTTTRHQTFTQKGIDRYNMHGRTCAADPSAYPMGY